jgi:hypothetical protein
MAEGRKRLKGLKRLKRQLKKPLDGVLAASIAISVERSIA